jgi:hypothetical protein
MGQDIVGSKMPTFASEQTQTSTCRPHALRLLSPRGDLARALVEQQALWKVRALSPLMPANAVREGARPCQGRGRGFESLRPLQDLTDLIPVGRCSQGNIWGNSVSANAYSVGRWSAYISSSLIQSLPTICDRTDGASRKSKPQSDRLLGLRHRDCGPRSQCSSAKPRSDSGKPSFHPPSMTVRTRYGARP